MKATTSNYRGFCIYKRTRTDRKGKTEYYIRLDGGKKKKSIRALAVEIGMDLGVIPINIHDVRNVIDKAIEIGLLDTGTCNLRPDIPLSIYMHKLLDDYDTSPWIEKERKRGRSLGEDHLENYERVFRLYISHLIDGMTIRTLSKDDVRRIISGLESLSPDNFNKSLDCLNIVCRYAVQEGDLEKNPVEEIGIRHRIAHPKEKEITTMEETDSFLSVMERNAKADIPFAKAAYFCTLLIVNAGIRNEEIQALRPDSFKPSRDPDYVLVDISTAWDESRHKLKPTTKSKKGRFTAITKSFYEALMNYHNKNPYGTEWILWSAKTGLPISTRCMNNHIHKAMEEIGISRKAQKVRGLSFYAMRHVMITEKKGELSEDEEDRLIALMKSVGHESKAINEHYTHLDESRALEKAKKRPAIPVSDL